MVPVTAPVVASARKLMRVAAGRVTVGARNERVGEGATVKVGSIAVVGVACDCIASIVAATTVATSLGEGEGMAEFELVHAAIATNSVSNAMNGFQRMRTLSSGFIKNLLIEKYIVFAKAIDESG